MAQTGISFNQFWLTMNTPFLDQATVRRYQRKGVFKDTREARAFAAGHLGMSPRATPGLSSIACQICSPEAYVRYMRQEAIYHNHEESRTLDKYLCRAGILGSRGQGRRDNPQREVSGPGYEPRGVIPILATSSTLNGYAYDLAREAGEIGYNLDTVAISGGKLDQIMDRIEAVYFEEARPLRLVLVAGFNDLIKQVSMDTIESQMQRLAAFMEHHGERFKVTMYFPSSPCSRLPD